MEKTTLRKGLIAFVLAAAMAFVLAGCGGGSSDQKTDQKENQQASQQVEQPKEATYESILADYTQKLEDQAPVLVDEYKAEAKDKKGNINALAELSNAKIAKLAETCDTGIAEMAELMYKNGDEYSTYEEWSFKLTDVYTEQAELITDAYMASAM